MNFISKQNQADKALAEQRGVFVESLPKLLSQLNERLQKASQASGNAQGSLFKSTKRFARHNDAAEVAAKQLKQLFAQHGIEDQTLNALVDKQQPTSFEL